LSEARPNWSDVRVSYVKGQKCLILPSGHAVPWDQTVYGSRRLNSAANRRRLHLPDREGDGADAFTAATEETLGDIR
jgi:hypothetical protein